MIENAYNLENFFVREKKKTNKNKTGKKSKRNSVFHMPLHSLLTSLIRYFLDTGWLSFLKYSKIFRVFSPINDLFIFVIYLFIFFIIFMIQKLPSTVLWLLIL